MGISPSDKSTQYFKELRTNLQLFEGTQNLVNENNIQLKNISTNMTSQHLRL